LCPLDLCKMLFLITTVTCPQCLQSRSGSVDEASLVAHNFVHFRREVGWPLCLTAKSVAAPLASGVHWLLPVSTT
jgi:hypothetical protein